MYEDSAATIDSTLYRRMSVQADVDVRSSLRRGCGKSGRAPIGTVGNLRQTEAVKVYGMNRYVDPADTSIMHERHAIYRLEQQPSWITRSPRNQNEVILGSIVGLRKPEYAPEPM